MLSLYLASLILGGGLLVLSVLGGEGAEADVDLDMELDLSVDTEGIEADVGADAAASKIFSLRGLIYTAFGFGATGSLLTLVGVTLIPGLVASVVMGLVSGAMVNFVFNYLRRTDSGALLTDATFAGLEGRVVLPLAAESAGAVVVTRGGREVRLRALPHGSSDADPADWQRVMVVEMEDGVARVLPMEGDHLLDS